MNVKRNTPFDATNPHLEESDPFCAFLAGLVYEAEPEIRRKLSELGYENANIRLMRSRLTSCLIVRGNGVTVMAFKGSSTRREWLNNLNVWLEPTQHGRLHSGFLYTIDQVGPLLNMAIIPDLILNSKIIVTGHSRGGPLALIFAYYLLQRGHKAFRTVEFGSPKYCDPEFACYWQGIPYKPTAQPKYTGLMAILIWAMRFKTIFIAVTLVTTVRYLLSFAETRRALRLALVNLIATRYRSVRSAFRQRRP